jgi:hypothetical protein
MSGALHESSRRLYSKEKVYAYDGAEVNYDTNVCGPKTHRKIHPPKLFQQDETVQAANLSVGCRTT